MLLVVSLQAPSRTQNHGKCCIYASVKTIVRASLLHSFPVTAQVGATPRPVITTVWDSRGGDDSVDEPVFTHEVAPVRVDPPYWALKPRERYWEPLVPLDTLSKRNWNHISLHGQVSGKILQCTDDLC
jgi:hypothetical protein